MRYRRAKHPTIGETFCWPFSRLTATPPHRTGNTRADNIPCHPAAKASKTVAVRLSTTAPVAPSSSNRLVSELKLEYVVSPPKKPMVMAERDVAVHDDARAACMKAATA
jgi:hypothetical protein